MRIISKIEDIKNDGINKIAVTMGNFDGVHLGHQSFLKYCKQSLENSCTTKTVTPLCVITFIPHPRQVLGPCHQFLINTYQERRRLLMNAGVDYLLEIDFNRDVSILLPEEFLYKYLLDHNVEIEKFFLGFDFAFGTNKFGDHDFMMAFCANNNINLDIHEPYKVEGMTVSSSLIRALINDGRLEETNKLLGRNFLVTGRVVKGDGRGRMIGFSTANLLTDNEVIIPANGVYITKTNCNSRSYYSVTNIGYNPTFKLNFNITIETHILNFERDIYGEEISILFLKKIRNEKKYSSVDDLVQQIREDIYSARQYFQID